MSLYDKVHSVTIALESGASPMPMASSRPTIPQRRLITSPVCFFFLSEMQASEDTECGSTAVSPGSNMRRVNNRRIPVAPTSPSSELRGRKPVIYLYPPSRLPDVVVKLLLTKSWSFSAVYPSPQTLDGNQIAAQSLAWAVEAEPDGRLVEKTTVAEVFREAT
jgi:hypothetical protein